MVLSTPISLKSSLINILNYQDLSDSEVYNMLENSEKKESIAQLSSDITSLNFKESSVDVVDEQEDTTADVESAELYLPKSGEQASNKKVFFILLKSFIGTGILFLPCAFASGGILFSNILLLLFGILSFWCYYILTLAKQITNVSNFENIGKHLFGKWMKTIITISLILSQLGFACTYVIFTSENLAAFFEFALNISNIPKEIFIFTQLLFFIPLSFLRKVSKLAIPTLFANIFTFIGLILVTVLTIKHLINGNIGPNVNIFFNTSDWHMFIGIAIFSFEGVGLIIPVQNSMASPEKFPLVLALVLVVCTLLFMFIGTIGYLAFGENIHPVILLSLNQNNSAVSAAQLLYSAAILLSTPLQLFPIFKIIEDFVFKAFKLITKSNNNKTDSSSENEIEGSRLVENEVQEPKENEVAATIDGDTTKIKWLKNLVRTLIVILVTIISYFGSRDISKFVAIVGSVACIPLIYIYPPLFHLKTHSFPRAKNEENKWRVVPDCLLVIFGIVSVLYTSYQSIFNS